MHVTSERRTLPPGTRVARRYVLGRPLGRGGSSIVYAASDPDGRPVAVKVLDPEPEHRATERERLFREARITEQLRHPAIVRVHDSGPLAGGMAYLVMERLDGITLEEHLDGRFWMDLDEARALARVLLDALSAAHDAGVIHRDVKPANLILQGGRPAAPKLIDFGIGRDLGDPRSRVTAPDVVVGTVGYMAPEQLFGDEPTPRTDVYAAGATLYEMLAGRPPHDIDGGDIRDVLGAMVRPPTPLASLRPAIPPALAAGVMRALEKAPRDRFADCRELADACGLEARAA